jgi:thymidylate synthase
MRVTGQRDRPGSSPFRGAGRQGFAEFAARGQEAKAIDILRLLASLQNGQTPARFWISSQWGAVEIPGAGLDDVLIELYKALLATDARNEGTRGSTKELLGVTLRIANPLARLSRSEDRGKPFSALGELLWYLSGSDHLDFIEPYVPRYKDDAVDGILPGAYGPRLFAKGGTIDQISNVTQVLIGNSGSRRAVVQLFDADDIIVRKKEIPCTTTLQFHLRDGNLHMSVAMRSNDAYFGVPHDVFCFTMLQEMMARRLGANLGSYIHHVGSMHVYDEFVEAMRKYVEEGYQRASPMPAMPAGEPFKLVPMLLAAEDLISHGDPITISDFTSESYWADIIRLVQAFWASGQHDRLDQLKTEFSYRGYSTYIDGRRDTKPRALRTRVQREVVLEVAETGMSPTPNREGAD